MSSVTKQDLFRCKVCNKYFRTRNSCPDHGTANRGKTSKSSEKSSAGDASLSNNVRCAEEGCDQHFKTISNLRMHLKNDHNFAFQEQNLLFNSRKDFLIWKEQTEVENNSRFVRTSGEKKNGANWTQYWQCYRSVKFLARSSNFCTAGIVSKRAENGEVSVYMCTTHYGHPEDDGPPPKKTRKTRRNAGVAFEEEIESGVRSILFAESEGTISPGEWPQVAVVPSTVKLHKQQATKKPDARAELRKQRTSTKTLLSQIGQLVEMVDDSKAFAQSRALLIQAWKVLAKCKMSGHSPSKKRVAESADRHQDDARENKIDDEQESSGLQLLQDVIQIQEIQLQDVEDHDQLTETREGEVQNVSHVQEIQIHDVHEVHDESGAVQHTEFTIEAHQC